MLLYTFYVFLSIRNPLQKKDPDGAKKGAFFFSVYFIVPFFMFYVLFPYRINSTYKEGLKLKQKTEEACFFLKGTYTVLVYFFRGYLIFALFAIVIDQRKKELA